MARPRRNGRRRPWGVPALLVPVGAACANVHVDDDSAAATPFDDATIASSDLPGDLACGATYEANIVVQNAGNTVWTRETGYRLGAVGDQDPFYTVDVRVDLPEGAQVPPGWTYAFAVPMTAPGTPGVYPTDWRMLREDVAWFGETTARDVSVACGMLRPGPPGPPLRR